MGRRLVLTVLVALLAVSGILFAYGAIGKDEGLLLAGAIAAPLLIITMFIYHKRASQREKISRLDGHLIHWEYTVQEADAVAARETPFIRKKSTILGILICFCVIVLFLPFILIASEENALSPILFIAVPVSLLPLLAIIIAPAVTAARIRRDPCITVIGRDHVFVANRYLGLNDYLKLNLEHARLLQAERPGMRWLRVEYSYRAGRHPVTMRKSVDIPVPAGMEAEAEDFAQRFEKNKKAKNEDIRRISHCADLS